MGIVLGPNQYGKAEVRMVHVDKSAPQHVITDLNVTTQLRGDFAETHLTGSNADVLPTDTQKNTVYALARQHGVGTPEEFALLLGGHFLGSLPAITGARIAVDAVSWDRISVGGVEQPTSFVKAGAERRTTIAQLDGDRKWVVSGLSDLVVLKTDGSQFVGFPKDRYTTLPEETDRILATSVTARWRYAGEPAYDVIYPQVRTLLLETFSTTYSKSLQQTLYAMATAVLETFPDVVEMRLSMPNKHHYVWNMEPYGLDNPYLVFNAGDRPYGLIEAVVLKDDAPPAGHAWDGVPGFA